MMLSDDEDAPFVLDGTETDAVTGRKRDNVNAHATNGTVPPIVSLSDIHGYLDAARSALLTLRDHDAYDPVVVEDDDGTLHWAGNDYVLVFNGDLIDRGPANVETLELVSRLLAEAPSGRVRVTLGNHEMGVLTPARFNWETWYCGRVGTAGRRGLIRAIQAGHVVAAYEGHSVTYAHAGHPDPYDVSTVNDALQDAASRLETAMGDIDDAQTQQAVIGDYPRVLGTGDGYVKGPGAGLVWLDFQYMPRDAPPQVVGHTRHDTITQDGAVVCQNVIRNTQETAGGEAVIVETPTDFVGLRRTDTGSVSQKEFEMP